MMGESIRQIWVKDSFRGVNAKMSDSEKYVINDSLAYHVACTKLYKK